MLHSSKQVLGLPILASGVEVGSLHDLLTDRHSWRIQLLAIDLGDMYVEAPAELAEAPWLHSLSLKISPHELKGFPPYHARALDVPHDTGRLPRWLFPVRGPAAAPHAHLGRPAPGEPDAFLEGYISLRHLPGVHVRASDGGSGHVESALLDDADRMVRFLVIDPINWWPGPHVLVPVEWVQAIESELTLRATKAQIRKLPEYDPSRLPLDDEAAAELYERYADEHPFA